MLQRFIPSMFHRRLLLLAVAGLLVLVAIIMQLTRLTVAQGDTWRQRAEQVLTSQRLIPTARGAIYDRANRLLAVDKPSYDVAAMYDVISGQWAYQQSRRDAWRANRLAWNELSSEERDRLAATYQPKYDVMVESLWSTLCDAGNIDRAELESRKSQVIRRVEQIASDVWARQAARREQELEENGEAAPMQRRPISEHRAAHALLTGVDEATLLRIRRLITEASSQAVLRKKDPAAIAMDQDMRIWESVSIEASRERIYPLETLTLEVDLSTFPGSLAKQEKIEVTVEGVAWTIIGDLRPIWQEDVQARPYAKTLENGEKTIDLGGYLPGDRTGRWGIEAAMENELRGQRGRIVEFVDGSQEEQRTDPQSGKHVKLALDVRLQARVQALLDPRLGLTRVQKWHAKEYSAQGDGTVDGEEPVVDPLRPKLGDELSAAAVVIDVSSGDVLAAVSMPTVGMRQMRENPDSVWKDTIRRPFVNRALAQPYQPGSTIKPFVLLAGITDNVLAPNGTIMCTGHLHPDHPDRYRCWIFKHYNGLTHDQVIGGPPDGAAAISRSCNIFFYTLGQRLGAVRLVQWYEKFGLGRAPQCGLPEAVRGRLPDLARASEPGAVGFASADAVMMGIGQGRVEWTVLQAASAYATLARGGYVLDPTLIREVEGQPPRERRSEDLRINPQAIEVAMQGLYEAVNKQHGTAHHMSLIEGKPDTFNFTGAKIYGKSGTATAPPLREPIDDDGDGKPDRYGPPLRGGDHAWFVGFVQKPGSTRPDYAIAVLVEYGGSGGAVAGPIANQILYALRAEGYL